MNRFIIAVLVAGLCSLSPLGLAKDHVMITKDDIDWGLLNPLRGDASPKAADLWGDRTKDRSTGMLVRFNKGFSSPPHIHNVTYRGVVIKGLLHNDDPTAQKMWLPTGSFWTQPAGESHITAANGQENLIYLEIDSGPYLVKPASDAYDNGERPINVEQRNLVWLGANDLNGLDENQVQVAYLWGDPKTSNGSFIKFPAGYLGSIENPNGLKAVVVTGTGEYQWADEERKSELSPSSFFSAKVKGQHKIKANTDLILYINSIGRYLVH